MVEPEFVVFGGGVSGPIAKAHELRKPPMPTFTRRITVRHATNGAVETFDITDDTLAGDTAKRVMRDLALGPDNPWTLHRETPELILDGALTIVGQTTAGQLDFDCVLEPTV